jgi:hypothetical protein
MLYSRAERVFILKHYSASKSFVAVREEFSNAYPDKARAKYGNTQTGNKISDTEAFATENMSSFGQC